MSRTASTEPQCLYKGDLYLPNTCPICKKSGTTYLHIMMINICEFRGKRTQGKLYISFIYLSISPSINQSINLSIHLSIYQSNIQQLSNVTSVTRYLSLFANCAGLLHLHVLDTSASLLLSLPCNYLTYGLPLLLPYIYACNVTANDTVKVKQAYAFVRLRTV